MSYETIAAVSFLLGCFLPFGWIMAAAVVSVANKSIIAVAMFLFGQYVRAIFTHKRGG